MCVSQSHQPEAESWRVPEGAGELRPEAVAHQDLPAEEA